MLCVQMQRAVPIPLICHEHVKWKSQALVPIVLVPINVHKVAAREHYGNTSSHPHSTTGFKYLQGGPKSKI